MTRTATLRTLISKMLLALMLCVQLGSLALESVAAEGACSQADIHHGCFNIVPEAGQGLTSEPTSDSSQTSAVDADAHIHQGCDHCAYCHATYLHPAYSFHLNTLPSSQILPYLGVIPSSSRVSIYRPPIV